MPALPSDIVRATRPARIVQREDTALQADYVSARDMAKEPQPGYFEHAYDAAAALDMAAALIGVAGMNRYLVSLGDELEVDPIAAIPTVHLVDSETGTDVNALLARIEIDDETETTRVELWG